MDVSYSQVRDALAFISPDEARHEWVTVGMSIKAEFGESGFELFDGWSRGSDKYKSRDCISTWKSIKPSGGVGIGTLIKKAKDNGWQPIKEERDEAAQRAYLAELAQRRAKAKADAEASEAFHARMGDVVAALSYAIIDWASNTALGQSEYLANKGVGAFGVLVPSSGAVAVINDQDETFQLITTGINDFFKSYDRENMPHLSVRYIKAGTVIVPMWSLKKGLRAVQLIFATGTKSFLKYGEKSGCFLQLGVVADGCRAVCVAEGYATAASVHMATGLPCLAAFDAGNLPTVAKLYAEAFPACKLMMCADNDTETKENAGVIYATQAAEAVGGGIAVPEDV